MVASFEIWKSEDSAKNTIISALLVKVLVLRKSQNLAYDS
jgi:hypothetical protein